MKRASCVAFAALALALAACSTAPASSSLQAGGSSSSGLPNPASQYCVDAGGTLAIVTEPAGELGLCQLGGALVEEWTLFRGKSGTDALRAFLAHAPFQAPAPHNGIGMANPASLYCGQVAGALKIVKSRDGSELGLCSFADGSQIEEWTLFRGPDSTGNEALSTLVRSWQ